MPSNSGLWLIIDINFVSEHEFFGGAQQTIFASFDPIV
jgi:hypothetical protein